MDQKRTRPREVSLIVAVAGTMLTLTYFAFALLFSFIFAVLIMNVVSTYTTIAFTLTNLIALSVAISSIEFAVTLATDRFGPLFYLYISPILGGVIAVQGAMDSEYLRNLAKTIMEKIRTPPPFVFVLR